MARVAVRVVLEQRVRSQEVMLLEVAEAEVLFITQRKPLVEQVAEVLVVYKSPVLPPRQEQQILVAAVAGLIIQMLEAQVDLAS